MKKYWKLVVMMVMVSLFVVACQQEEVIDFSDAQLESALREEINLTDGDIHAEDVQSITSLDLADQGITNLNGMEHFISLTELYLQNNNIMNLDVLTELKQLKEVNLSQNPALENEEQQTIIDQLTDYGVKVIIEDPVETINNPDGPGGFLWKVEHGETTVYLQGTIHLATEDFYPLHEKIENAYLASNIIVPEVDITSINPFEVQGLTTELATYSDGTNLRDHISEDLYAKLDTKLQEFGVPLQMLEGFQPWFLSDLIQQLMVEQLGYIEGVDEYFLTRANEDGKEIIDLETVEQQLRIFADAPIDYQIQMLEDSLIDIEDFDAQFQEMFSLYKAGDGEELLASLMDEDAELTAEEQEVMEALNDNRNKEMAEKITRFLEEDSDHTYFVIVGSLHLLLEPHIVSLLEEKGFEVERIH